MPRCLVLGIALAVLGTGSIGLPQEAVPAADELLGIEHRPPPCLDTEDFPLIEARASSSEADRRPRQLVVRFKAEDDADWYEIVLQPATDLVFRAALPKPLTEAVRVTYYIASERPEHRTPEYTVNVLMGGCPGARAAPAELTESIRVRRTSSDQTEIPRGFSPEGIRTGGPSSRTTLGMVAGAGAGAGIAALVIPGEEPSLSNNVGTGSQEALRACFMPDPIPDIDSGETIRFDASCTTPSTVSAYQWNFGDGTAGTGSSVEHLFTPGGIYMVTLTVSDGQRTDGTSRVVRVRATPTACFITTPDPPRIRVTESINFNAECSVGDRDGGPSPITSYEWDFGDGRPGGEGVFVSRQFIRADLYGVTLTVTNQDGRQDKTTQFVVVDGPTSESRTEVTFTTELALPPGNAAQLFFNRSESVATVAPSPQRYRVRARSGENVVDARLLAEASDPGRWRIDFRATPEFVPGSIQVDSGEVFTMDAQSVVFRLSGAPVPIRFRFRLEE